MNFSTKQEELFKSITTLTGKTVKTKPFTTSNLLVALDEISTGKNYSSVIEQIRSIPDIDDRQDFKRNHLPFFTIGEFRDNERKKNNLVQTKFAIFDYDHVLNWQDKWDQVTVDQYVFAAFRSPSGDGIKVIYQFDVPITDSAQYSALYKYYAGQFKIDLGEEPDKTSDCSRACYISHDPNLYLNESAAELPTDIDFQSLPSCVKNDNFIDKLQNGCSADEARTPVLTEMIGMLMSRGFDRDYTLGIALGWNMRNAEPHTDEKIIYTVNDLYDRYSNQSISEKTKHFYSYETSIFEARIIGDEFSIKNIGEKKFCVKLNIKDKDEKAKYLSHVIINNDLHTLRRIDYVSEINSDESYYEFNDKEGVFCAHIKPSPIKIKDNDFIEKYLDELFGNRKQVIKEWLAVYCNTNYRKLPHLIFTGDRGTSKSTFVEMISGIFPSLTSWTKELEGNFNPDAEKKLVVIDESDSKGKIQYRTLKKYSGQSYIQVNKKYLPQYQVRNNVNLIIMSNDDDAIYVEREEAPANESNNQFFVHKFHKFSGVIDPDFSQKLLDRIGYYVQTELATVFSSLTFDGNRYSIKVPITDEEKILFQNSITEVESESDGFINRLMMKVSDPNFEWIKFVNAGYIPTDYFSSNNRVSKHKIIADLQRRGYLTNDKAERYFQIDGKRPYLYKISDRWLTELRKEMQSSLVGSIDKTKKDMFVPMSIN